MKKEFRIDLFSGYPKGWFRFDALAGLTTAAVVVPKAMAYAIIAGPPVQTGLYVALVRCPGDFVRDDSSAGIGVSPTERFG